jgi:hypothetical protein
LLAAVANHLLTVGMIGMIMMLLASMLAERKSVFSLADETNAVEEEVFDDTTEAACRSDR